MSSSLINIALICRRNLVSNHHFVQNVRYCTKEKPQIPKNVLKYKSSALDQETNGEIYDKRPFKMLLKKGKKYSWCLCGKSHSQPICDGTHKNIFLKINHRPIRFEVDETKEYWLCNCKQTKHRPFCDGTHKLPHIQSAITKIN